MFPAQALLCSGHCFPFPKTLVLWTIWTWALIVRPIFYSLKSVTYVLGMTTHIQNCSSHDAKERLELCLLTNILILIPKLQSPISLTLSPVSDTIYCVFSLCVTPFLIIGTSCLSLQSTFIDLASSPHAEKTRSLMFSLTLMSLSSAQTV